MSHVFILFGLVRLSRSIFHVRNRETVNRDRRTGGPEARNERRGGDVGSEATGDPPGGEGAGRGARAPAPRHAERTTAFTLGLGVLVCNVIESDEKPEGR